jgi:hypothetical protein
VIGATAPIGFLKGRGRIGKLQSFEVARPAVLLDLKKSTAG